LHKNSVPPPSYAKDKKKIDQCVGKDTQKIRAISKIYIIINICGWFIACLCSLVSGAFGVIFRRL